MLRSKFFQSSFFSILQFLGNFLPSFLDEDGSSSPIHNAHVFFHVELDLSNEYLPIIVAFEMQALVAIGMMHILNFFVPNLGCKCRTQSNFIFPELNSHQE